MSKPYQELEDGKSGDIVRTKDGRVGTVLWFQPALWQTHAMLKLKDGSKVLVSLTELTRVRREGEPEGGRDE